MNTHSHVAGRPPEPLHTVVVNGDEATTLVRIWAEGDAARCKLCRVCDAVPGPRELWVCSQTVTQYVSPDSAPGFSPDFPL